MKKGSLRMKRYIIVIIQRICTRSGKTYLGDSFVSSLLLLRETLGLGLGDGLSWSSKESKSDGFLPLTPVIQGHGKK